MSQKTNPISLRLQKNNQNFALPWFADFFFTENYHYGFEIENYIAAFLRETQYSKAFFSAKSLYKKFSIFLFIQDARSDKKEKQVSFKVKPSKKLRSSKNYSSSAIFKVLQEKQASENLSTPLHKNFKSWVQKNLCILSLLDYHRKLCFRERQQLLQKQIDVNDYTFSCAFNKISKQGVPLTQLKEMQMSPKVVPSKEDTSFVSDVKQNEESFLPFDMMKASLKKQIRNNFLRFKQNYAYSFSAQTFSHLKKSKSVALTGVDKNRTDITQNFGGFTSESFNETVHFIPFGCFSAKTISLPKPSMKPTFSSSLKAILLDHYKKGDSSALYMAVKSKESVNFPCTNPFSPVTVNFESIRFIRDRQNVMSLLDQIITLLEKRVSFRQIKSRLFKDLSEDLQIRGVRISCSGRLGGRSKKAQKAKMQSGSWGETSLNAFSSKLLFGSKSAYTPYGKVGVKLWLCFQNERC